MEDTISALCTDNQTSPTVEPLPSLDSSILTAITLNCQYLLAKQESFINLIEFHTPDIVFGLESWLKSDIKSSEIFPSNYALYHHDHDDGYDGVFVACCDSHVLQARPYQH